MVGQDRDRGGESIRDSVVDSVVTPSPPADQNMSSGLTTAPDAESANALLTSAKS